MTSCHKPLDQNYDWVQAVFYSLTHRNSSQTFLGKNAERFEIATSLSNFDDLIIPSGFWVIPKVTFGN